jgi:hypothetical protein
MSRLLLLSGFLLLGVGCASTGSSARADEPALALGQQAGEPLLVRGSSVTGPASSLTISEDGMRGRFRDVPVSLKWDYQEVSGMVAGRGTRLELAEGDDTRIWGTFGGAVVDLTLEGEWLQGRVGGCGYALKRHEGGYVGRRTCGGPLEANLQVAFPEPLLARPLGEKATLMTLMLINSTPTYSPTLSPARLARPRGVGMSGRPDPFQW